MVGQPRILRLVLLGALSIAVLSPGAAQAFVFSAPRYALLEGEGSGPGVVKAAGIAKECKAVSFNGTYYRRTLELEPIYDECMAKTLTGLPAKYVLARCVYLLHAKATKPGKVKWKANVDIHCPTNYEMQWLVYENMKHYFEAAPICTTALLPQKGVGTAELSNVAGSPSKIAIHWNLNRIKYKVLYGSALFCGSLPGVVRRYASYRDDATIGAIDLGGQRLPLAVRG